jgi:hypothetical protein
MQVAPTSLPTDYFIDNKAVNLTAMKEFRGTVREDLPTRSLHDPESLFSTSHQPMSSAEPTGFRTAMMISGGGVVQG